MFKMRWFLTTKLHRNIHNFLKHYTDGKAKPFDNKPKEIKQIGSKITYEFAVGKYNQDYNFSNSEEAVNDFLLNVKVKFRANGKVTIKCGSSIENIQPAATEYNVPILNVLNCIF